MFLIGRISFPSNAFYDSFTFHNPGLPGQSTFSAKADIAIVAASSLCGCRLMIRHFHWRDWGLLITLVMVTSPTVLWILLSLVTLMSVWTSGFIVFNV